MAMPRLEEQDCFSSFFSSPLDMLLVWSHNFIL